MQCGSSSGPHAPPAMGGPARDTDRNFRVHPAPGPEGLDSAAALRPAWHGLTFRMRLWPKGPCPKLSRSPSCHQSSCFQGAGSGRVGGAGSAARRWGGGAQCRSGRFHMPRGVGDKWQPVAANGCPGGCQSQSEMPEDARRARRAEGGSQRRLLAGFPDAGFLEGAGPRPELSWGVLELAGQVRGERSPLPGQGLYGCWSRAGRGRARGSGDRGEAGDCVLPCWVQRGYCLAVAAEPSRQQPWLSFSQRSPVSSPECGF